jgi:hypothetical protein
MLDGVVTFFGSYHAMRAESVLRKNGWKARLIPGPREISPNCGVALRFDWDQRDAVKPLLEGNLVQYEDTHYYPEKGRDRR